MRYFFIAFIIAFTLFGFSTRQCEPVVKTVTQTDTVIVPMTLDNYRVWHVTQEALRADVPVTLALAVSRAENWGGDTTAVSSAGAVGIMQIMPDIWGDTFLDECYGGDPLLTARRNACLGARILKLYWTAAGGDWNEALRLYNGSSRYPNAGNRYVAAVLRNYQRVD